MLEPFSCDRSTAAVRRSPGGERPKLFCLVIAAVMLVCAPAARGDPAPSSMVNWTGFYAGLNGGLGGGAVWPRNDQVSPPINFLGSQSVDSQNHRLGGFLAGGQVGYNYEFSNRVVLGVETDVQWSNIGARRQDDTASVINIGNPLQSLGLFTTETRISQNWFGTTRLRLGYSPADRLLAYVTGGLAYSEFSVGNSGTGTAASALFSGTLSTISGANTATRLGWTAGAGFEYALDRHLSLKSEYLYTQYSGLAAPFLDLEQSTPPVTSGTYSSGTLGIHLVRAGLNYKFGEPSGEVQPATSVRMTAWRPNWSGFHAGINGGFGGGTFGPSRSETALDQFSQIPPLFDLSATNVQEKLRSSGFLAGGQFGYDYEFSNGVVAGLETDMQWSGIGAVNRSTIFTVLNPPLGTGAVQHQQLTIGQDWFGTTRLRLGYEAFNRGLIYATGGLAYSHFSASFSGFTNDPSNLFQSTTGGFGSSTRLGWTAGAGVEYALAQNLTFKTEYLYSAYAGLSLPYQGSAFFGNLANPANFGTISTQGTLGSGTLGLHLLRVGLNWQLGDLVPWR